MDDESHHLWKKTTKYSSSYTITENFHVCFDGLERGSKFSYVYGRIRMLRAVSNMVLLIFTISTRNIPMIPVARSGTIVFDVSHSLEACSVVKPLKRSASPTSELFRFSLSICIA
jgi:hypothetical protein